MLGPGLAGLCCPFLALVLSFSMCHVRVWAPALTSHMSLWEVGLRVPKDSWWALNSVLVLSEAAKSSRLLEKSPPLSGPWFLCGIVRV